MRSGGNNDSVTGVVREDSGVVREGVLTIMFTDVEGSTDLTRRLGDTRARRLIESHQQTVREQVGRHGGREVASIGDGFMLTFDSTRRAVTCAVAIQRALEEQAREQPDERIQVRIGINVGEVLDHEGDPFGAAINAAQRVAAHAKGGQVLVAEAVRHLAGTIPSVTFRDRGRFPLKGFDERWRLYEVVWPKPDAPAPAPRRVPRWRHLTSRFATLVAGAALLAVVALAALLLARGSEKPLTALAPDTVGILDVASGKWIAEVAVGGRPSELASAEEGIWVANFESGTVSRVDPATRQ